MTSMPELESLETMERELRRLLQSDYLVCRVAARRMAVITQALRKNVDPEYTVVDTSSYDTIAG